MVPAVSSNSAISPCRCCGRRWCPPRCTGFVVTFNLFSLIYFLSGGGPLRQTEILLTVAFRLVNEQRLYGVAAAFAVYIFFILLLITLATNAITRATESYAE